MRRDTDRLQFNNRSRDRPEPFWSFATRDALPYYLNEPIKPHEQATAHNPFVYNCVGGERVWTSAKEVRELEPIQLDQMTCPFRHVGEW